MKSLWKLVGIGVIILIVFLPTITKLHELESRKDALQRQIKIYEVQNRALEEEIYKLKNDPDYLEKIAREKLKVAKEGEVVYKVETEEKK
jgi:cell division protein FtsB